MPELFAATEASLKAYQDRIKELEEALKPFAGIGATLFAISRPDKAVLVKCGDNWQAYLEAQDFMLIAELLRK